MGLVGVKGCAGDYGLTGTELDAGDQRELDKVVCELGELVVVLPKPGCITRESLANSDVSKDLGILGEGQDAAGGGPYL